MGYDAIPSRLILTQRRCNGLRRLACGVPRTSTQSVAKLVQQCADTTAADGLFYNVSILALERALFHRITFRRSLEYDLGQSRNHAFDQWQFIQSSLACHIDVLMHTSNVTTEE